MLFVKEKTKFICNIFQVLVGDKTWIGYCESDSKQFNLPKIKSGVINPIIASKVSKEAFLNYDSINLRYAKNYSVETDLVYLFKAFKMLGH